MLVVMVHDEIPTSEAMALLGISDPSQMSRWVREGKLTPSRRVGTGPKSPMLFWRSDIESLADQMRADLAERIARLDAAREAS